MNNSIHQKQSSKDLSNPINKKKAIPISINTNPAPRQFLFKNKLSNIASSYKNIGDKIQNVDKTRYTYKQNIANNQLLFNSFLSGNSKSSFNSQTLSKSKNESKISNQRITTAKTLISTSCNQGGLINPLNSVNHHIDINIANFAYTKTENSYTNQNKENIKPKVNNNKDSTRIIKKNKIRQKSIDVINSNLKSIKHDIEYKNIKNKSINNNSNHNLRYNIKRHSKGALSQIGEQINHFQRFNQKIDQLKFEFQNCKRNLNKIKGVYNTNTNKLINNQTIETIRVMNSLQAKKIRVRSREENQRTKALINNNDISRKTYSSNPKIVIKLKERSNTLSNNNIKIKKGNNHSISLGEKPLKLIYSKESKEYNKSKQHNKSNELSPIKVFQEKIPHRPITSIPNVQSVLINYKEESNEKQHIRSMSKNNHVHEVLSLEIIEDVPTERLFSDNYYINNKRVKSIFDLSFEAEDQIEDKFDDLNSIVKILPFSKVNLSEASLFTENNMQYKQFEIKFINDYDHLYNKIKFSERKKMNISLSTQESSCKKCLSPFV